MKDFTPEYLEQIRDIISGHDDERARTALADLHPADIAELYRDLNLAEPNISTACSTTTLPPRC